MKPLLRVYRRRVGSIWVLYFAFLTFIYLLPLWLFTYFPTADGPVHLGSAAVLKELAQGDAPFLSTFFYPQWSFATNQLYHGLLVSLGSLMPFLTAEKLILSFYVVMLPLATLFAVRRLRGEALAVFLVFPFVYSYIVLLGLYNLALGLVVFMFTVGVYLSLARRPTLAKGVLLASLLLLAYFVHVIAAASALLSIGVMAVFKLLASLLGWEPVSRGVARGDARPAQRGVNAKPIHLFGGTLLTFVPVVALIGIFFLTTGQDSASDASLSNFVGVPTMIRTFLTQPSSPLAVGRRVLTTYTYTDVFVTAPWNLLLLVLAGGALYRTFISSTGAARARLRRHPFARGYCVRVCRGVVAAQAGRGGAPDGALFALFVPFVRAVALEQTPHPAPVASHGAAGFRLCRRELVLPPARFCYVQPRPQRVRVGGR